MPTDWRPSGATKTTLTVRTEAPIEFRHQLRVGFQDSKSVQNESNHILAALLLPIHLVHVYDLFQAQTLFLCFETNCPLDSTLAGCFGLR